SGGASQCPSTNTFRPRNRHAASPVLSPFHEPSKPNTTSSPGSRGSSSGSPNESHNPCGSHDDAPSTNGDSRKIRKLDSVLRCAAALKSSGFKMSYDGLQRRQTSGSRWSTVSPSFGPRDRKN